MSLITNAHLKAICDRLAAAYTQALPALGTSSGNPAAGTVRGTINNLLADVVGFDIYQEEADFATAINNVLGGMNLQTAFAQVQTFLQQNSSGALYKHMLNQGSTVDASIVSLATYLTFYNTTPFTVLLTPDFAALWTALGLSALPAAGVMSPAIQPDYTATASAHGMGDYDIASTTYTKGDSVATATYACVNPVVEVITAFSGGAAHPTVQISGTDDLGAACTFNSALDLGANNPTAALSGVTVTPAISVAARQTVALSSVSGIVAGSTLTINKNKPDQEVIIVEQVISSTIVAVFKLAHASGASVDGWNSFSPGNLSTGAGRRLQKLANSSGITLTLSSHSAGKVRIAGAADRVAI